MSKVLYHNSNRHDQISQSGNHVTDYIIQIQHTFQLESTGVPMDLWSLCGVHVDFPIVALPKFVCFSRLQLDSN
jgi:hypothetical protein